MCLRVIYYRSPSAPKHIPFPRVLVQGEKQTASFRLVFGFISYENNHCTMSTSIHCDTYTCINFLSIYIYIYIYTHVQRANIDTHTHTFKVYIYIYIYIYIHRLTECKYRHTYTHKRFLSIYIYIYIYRVQI